MVAPIASATPNLREGQSNQGNGTGRAQSRGEEKESCRRCQLAWQACISVPGDSGLGTNAKRHTCRGGIFMEQEGTKQASITASDEQGVISYSHE